MMDDGKIESTFKFENEDKTWTTVNLVEYTQAVLMTRFDWAGYTEHQSHEAINIFDPNCRWCLMPKPKPLTKKQKIAKAWRKIKYKIGEKFLKIANKLGAENICDENHW